jgi:hypothetical protein
MLITTSKQYDWALSNRPVDSRRFTIECRVSASTVQQVPDSAFRATAREWD